MKKATMFVFAIALCGSSLSAQELKSAHSNWQLFVGPAEEAPAALMKIFSNLGPAETTYTETGYYVAGPASALGESQFIGLPFTPADASHATELEAAISWNSLGANQVNLSLYSDNSGVPGTLLAGPKTVKNLPVFGTCCTLAKAAIPSTALTAGTQYWIVASTPATGTGDDSEDVWNAVYQVSIAGDIAGAGYAAFPANNTPAGAVYGTIP
jgi:hypothetical protein